MHEPERQARGEGESWSGILGNWGGSPRSSGYLEQCEHLWVIPTVISSFLPILLCPLRPTPSPPPTACQAGGPEAVTLERMQGPDRSWWM